MELKGVGGTDTALHNKIKKREKSGRLCLLSFIVTVLVSFQPNVVTPISSEPIKTANPKYIWAIDSNKATQIHLTLKPICSNRMCHLLLAMVQGRDFSFRDIWKMWRALLIFGNEASGAEAMAFKTPWGMRSWELLCASPHWLGLAGILLRVGMGDRGQGCLKACGGLEVAGEHRQGQWPFEVMPVFWGISRWPSAWDQHWEFKKFWMGNNSQRQNHSPWTHWPSLASAFGWIWRQGWFPWW